MTPIKSHIPILIASTAVIALIIGVIFWSNDSDISDTKVERTAEEMHYPIGSVTKDNTQ